MDRDNKTAANIAVSGQDIDEQQASSNVCPRDSLTTSRRESSSSSSPATISSSYLRKFKAWLPYIAHFLYLVISLLMNGSFMPIARRGFFCDDSSINYPVKGDTIDFKKLFMLALIIPFIIILLCDRLVSKILGMRQKRRERRSSEDDEMLSETTNPSNNDSRQQTINRNQYLEYIRRPITKTGEASLFIFGFSTTMFLTGIGKIAVGRLRPHFMQKCQPNIDCQDPKLAFTYIQEFKCNNPSFSDKDLSYITTSWPSGHASTIFYSMLYLSIYLHEIVPSLYILKRPTSNYNPLFLYTLSVFMMSAAGYISLTRVSDYHHHPLDVFSGLLIGVLTACVLSKYMFKYERIKKK